MQGKSWPPWHNGLIRHALDILLPQRCAACGQYLGIGPQGPLCQECEGAAFPIKGPVCPRCGTPFPTPHGPDHLCGKCTKQPPPWDEARSLFLYKDVVRTLIHNLKFRNRPSATRAISYLATRPPDPTADWPYDLICPIPTSKKRLRQRGFNQCLELAKGIFTTHRKMIDPFALTKVRHTPPQSGLSKEERAKNVRGAFEGDPRRVHGLKILLFDDIYTTGATAREATKALRRAGASSVYLFTLARV